ncbi:MAG: trimeric intracellular cation channel family protein [Pseudomonas sp.]
METLFYLSVLVGVAVFAVTGSLLAGRNAMDLFGVLVIALVTALGGGTLRDLILDNHPVSWIGNELYLVVASLGAFGTVLWARFIKPLPEKALLIADAFGLAVFTVIGTEVALRHEVPVSTAVIMGVMTGVAGGVLRDVLCNQIPLIFQKEVYATACIAGSLVYMGLLHLGSGHWAATGVAMLVVLGTRIAAIYWGLALPRFHLLDRRR